MRKIAVAGAGKIGSTIALMLAETGDYEVELLDRDRHRLGNFDAHPCIAAVGTDISDGNELRQRLSGKFAVISAAPFQLTTAIAEAAASSSVHYLDLTEDVASTRTVKQLAQGASKAFIPQCGLAPGFISIVAAHLIARFDRAESVRLRVGALPQYPSNALNYNLTWSTDGVINEYIERCEAIVDGKLVEVPAMEECEEFSLDGIKYEAFNTSGGLGTLCEALAGKVRTLNYKTIRYPGHASIFKVLLNDLNLRNRRDILKDILENSLPATAQDVVVVFATISGMKNGQLRQESFAHKIYSGQIAGRSHSAIQITTSAGICAVLDMLSEGHLPQQGFIRQESISLNAFLANRFGVRYAKALDRSIFSIEVAAQSRQQEDTVQHQPHTA